jgi:hypothetical protein
MIKPLYRLARGARLSSMLAWALVSGLVQGIVSVLVLFFYRACLLLALSAGALLFALFRIDAGKRKNGDDTTLEE